MSYYGNLLNFISNQQGLGEQQRQFNLGFNEDSRRFNNNFGEDRRRYDNSFLEGVRQFDAGFGENQRQFDNSFMENRRQFNENLGLDWEGMGQGLLGLVGQLDNQQFGQDLSTFSANEGAQQQQWQNLFNTLAAFMPQEQDGRVNVGGAFGVAQNQDAMRMQAQQNSNNNFFGGLGALGGILTQGGFFSSRKYKDKTGDMDGAEALEIVKSLPVERWKYKGDSEEHIGTYAEEWNEAVGKDSDSINVVDYLGILTAAVQELARRAA